jgi:hypothetical protein
VVEQVFGGYVSPQTVQMLRKLGLSPRQFPGIRTRQDARSGPRYTLPRRPSNASAPGGNRPT